jgi:diamine N-acetyltransferase
VLLGLRPATAADAPWMAAAETAPDAARWVSPWTEEQHLAALDEASAAQLVIEEDEREPVGHVLLNGIGRSAMGVELRRIVIGEPGQGTGTLALILVLEHCFEELGTHRVWLDVMPENQRARRAYENAGFREEGVLRDALRRRDGSLVPLVLMAMLETEWRAREGV